MTYTVKIYGAGSIGNHLAHACRNLDWSVTLVDTDPDALRRTREAIYPDRYGQWDDQITLAAPQDASGGTYDLIFIGTPPDSHIPLALEALENHQPKAVVLEKPLCGPDLAGCDRLLAKAQETATFVGVGYNHTLTPNTQRAEQLLADNALGQVQTLTVRWIEHWGGIFNAHPWLDGPADTYLGFASRGGGACGEHSHGINIWQHFARQLGQGRVSEVSATLQMVEAGGARYDQLAQLNLKTENGLVGYVIQDVVTDPPVKTLRVQGDQGHLSWHANYQPGHDAIDHARRGEPVTEELFAKTRPDDFKYEVEHLRDLLDGNISPTDSPIHLERGLETMLVVAAAHQSHATGQTIRIDYTQGYSPQALHAGQTASCTT